MLHIDELLFTIDKEDDIYSEIVKNHLNDRRIIINQEITDDLLENVCLMILKWNAEFIDEIKDREYYMFAEEAKDRHIVDKIIGIGIGCDIDEIILMESTLLSYFIGEKGEKDD